MAMNSENARIFLLSCPGRQDVVDFWFFAQRAFWPDCPWPVDVLGESTIRCWARRLLAYVESVKEDWLLLFVDDAVLQYPVDTEKLDRCLCYSREHPRVGLFILSQWLVESFGDIGIPIEDLPGFAHFKRTREAYKTSGAIVPCPSLWRREALLNVTRDAVENMTPAMDDGFAGFYSWELMIPHTLYERDWDVIIAEHKATPIRYINAVKQGRGWTYAALVVVEKLKELGLEYTLAPGRGYRKDQPGFKAPMLAWGEGPRPCRKPKERIERNDT